MRIFSFKNYADLVFSESKVGKMGFHLNIIRIIPDFIWRLERPWLRLAGTTHQARPDPNLTKLAQIVAEKIFIPRNLYGIHLYVVP